MDKSRPLFFHLSATCHFKMFVYLAKQNRIAAPVKMPMSLVLKHKLSSRTYTKVPKTRGTPRLHAPACYLSPLVLQKTVWMPPRAIIMRTMSCNAKCNSDQSEGNLSAVLYGVNDLRLEQRPIPKPKDDEVLLQMGCVGICGSDVHYLVNGKIGDFIVKAPMVMGHEPSGIVAKLGKRVTNLKVGDRVAIEPGVPCRKCTYCKEGKYNLCPTIVFCGTPPHHGNLCQYYVHAADFCFKLPDHVSLEEGALLEPLSVAVHACRRANVQFGSDVLICGSGPIGLVTVLCAKAMGATNILITDVVQHKLDIAKKLGANHTLLLTQDMDEQCAIKCVHEALGTAPNISIDSSGAESAVRLAIKATKTGGVAVVIGLGKPEIKVPLISAVVREVDLRGIFRFCNDYPLALGMVASGKVNVKPLITHNFKLEEVLEAFETAKTGKGNPIKIMIHCLKK